MARTDCCAARVIVVLVSLSGCDAVWGDAPAPIEPAKGETAFVSADGIGREVPTNDSPSTSQPGDIYRALGDHHILDLNGYRGLQMIDLSDPSAPHVESRLPAAGRPTELYVADGRALVLLDNWSGYYTARNDLAIERRQGALLLNVDISDRTQMKALSQTVVPGWIRASHLTQAEGRTVLYVVYDRVADTTDGAQHPYVKSFEVRDDAFVEKDELALGTTIAGVQMTDDVLVVNSSIAVGDVDHLTLTAIDIRRRDGTLIQGDTIASAGTPSMSIYAGVLRTASPAYSSTREQYIETFDISDPARLKPLDYCTFGAGETDLEALFLPDRALIRSRRDGHAQFRVFSLDARGACEEHDDVVGTGNDFFLRSALDGTRVFGMAGGSVRLYDPTQAENPLALLASAAIDYAGAEFGTERGYVDDNVMSVIEGAVSVAAADGTVETGLVMVPFRSWDGADRLPVTQLMTFSDHTLTARGTIGSNLPVQRSFAADAMVAASATDEQLLLFDTANPGQPKALGRLDAAPKYDHLFVFGDYVARVQSAGIYSQQEPMSRQPPRRVDILPRTADLDARIASTSFEVPADADLVQVGDLLVSITFQVTNDPPAAYQTPQYKTAIAVFDLSDPLHVSARGSLETDRLRPSPRYAGLTDVALRSDPYCPDCGGQLKWLADATQSDHYVVGNAIAFARREAQNTSLGTIHSCTVSIETSDCDTARRNATTCSDDISGQITCSTLESGDESCSGGFLKCPTDAKLCTKIDRPKNGTTETCADYPGLRYWRSLVLDVLDLRNPDAPTLAPSLALPANEESSTLVAEGTNLYVNFQQPYDDPDDPRWLVKHYFHMLDLSDPHQVVVGAPINVPGEVIAKDESSIYTRDLVWDVGEARTLISRLVVRDNRAQLQATHLFKGGIVRAVRLDGAGHILVSSDSADAAFAPYGLPLDAHTLSILDATDLETEGQADVPRWAMLMDARAGRALYSVDGGLLAVDVADAAHPKAQAYVPTDGWPSEVLNDRGDLLFAAGPCGVYRLNADAHNLTAP
jgi:hypothetical protein